VSPGARCAKCGHPASARDTFCTSCGAPIESATTPGEPAPEAFETPLEAGASEPPARHVAAGTLIDNKYKVDRVLGEGGMGVVYLAEDVHTGAFVVLKAIRPELAHRKDIRDRTLAEGRALARIDHPNVVHLNAVVEDASGLWLVMQFIDGESLDKTIKRYKAEGHAIAFTVAIDIFRQILHGVAAAHREGVIHRDLKPANVLVRRKDGVAKVTDFGIAKPEEQARVGQGKTKGIIGSLWYMSPEQVQGRRDLDKRVDVYALGILLFELLTGRVPFDAESSYDLMRKHVEEPLPKAVAERPDLPAWVDDVLARACAKNRDERFSSCDELLSAIEVHVPARATALISGPHTRVEVGGPTPKAQTADPAPTAAATSVTAAAEAGGSRAWLWALGAAALLGAGAIGAWKAGLFEAAPPKKPKPIASDGDTSAELTASAPPSSSAAAPQAPLDKLVGRWRSEAGTDFDAVRVGDAVEFRVVDEKQFAPSDYRAGEARFTLRGGAANAFTVEDNIRPKAPDHKDDAGKEITFSPRSRTSCQEVWTAQGGRPLVATLDGARLSVDFVRILPDQSVFKVEGTEVVGCVNLRRSPVSRARTVLTKQL
jgi:serine/threonine-protein kinase